MAGSGKDSREKGEMNVGENSSKAPTVEMIETELEKEQYKRNYSRVLRSTIYILIVVAAATVIIAVLVFPMLQITGTSMADTLKEGDIVLAWSGSEYGAGDVAAFYYNNNILVKRVIATSGDWVDIDEEGNVSVNGEVLDEPYVSEKSLGYCNIDFPYQVPDGRSFLLGDHRDTSMDSRSEEIGCVADDMMVGKIVFCVWPLTDFGFVR